MHFTNPLVCALGLFALADAQITLGSAGSYAVLAGSTITSTGLTVIGAKIGLSPGTSITGFPPGLNQGEDISNAAAVAAKADLQTAFTALAALPATTSLTGQDLGGQILTAGVYNFASSGGLTGILTLDAQGDPNAVFVFQFGSTLTTATASSVVLINGANPCNVYWQVGSSATLGTATLFLGNVIAQASITATTGVAVSRGGLFALTAAVTLDTNAIDLLGACGSAASVPVSSTTAVISSTTSTTAVIPSTTSTTPVAPPVTQTVTATETEPISTVTATEPISTVTTTSTSTITDPASTTTLTVTVDATITVTQTVATSQTTCTSTSTQWSTKSATQTAKATACSKSKRDAIEKRAKKPVTKTKTVTSTCAGHTSTHTAKGAASTKIVKVTYTSTHTVWQTKSATTTHTSTKTPACTANAKRDYQRMFE